MMLESLARDTIWAFRRVQKRMGLLLVVVVSLSIGVGGTLTMFFVVNTVALRPLPYPDSENLVELWEGFEPNCMPECLELLTWETAQNWRGSLHSYSYMALAASNRLILSGSSAATRVVSAAISEDFFTLLGVAPALGRLLNSGDGEFSAEGALVLSHHLWTQQFGRDSSIIGRTVFLSGTTFTVVGVTAPEAVYPPNTDLWIPANAVAQSIIPGRRAFKLVARLIPGISIQQAESELRSLAQRGPADPFDAGVARPTTVLPITNQIRRSSSTVWLLFGATAVTLLIASLNIAALLSLQAADRHHETAIRATLGAGRLRLVGLASIETLLLIIPGILAGILLTILGIDFTERLVTSYSGAEAVIAVDTPSLWFAGSFIFLVVLLISLPPVLTASQAHTPQAFQNRGIGISSGRRGRLVREWLLIGQVAGVVMLLVVAGSLTESFLRSQRLRFEPKKILWTRVSLAEAGYGSPQIQIVANELLERVESHSGVERAAAWISIFPKAPVPPGQFHMLLDGREPPSFNEVALAAHYVTPGFFETMAVEVVTGRRFGDVDGPASPAVAIVNERAAAMWWPGANPIGKRLKVGSRPETPWATVVGVVADANITERAMQFAGAAGWSWPYIYRPLAQTVPTRNLQFAIRTYGNPSDLIADIRSEIIQIAPGVPIEGPINFHDQMVRAGAIDSLLYNLRFVGAFTFFGLFLSMLGIYALVAQGVRQRRHELGIRIALGARPNQIVRSVSSRVLTVTVLGISLGAGLVLYLAPYFDSYIRGIRRIEPFVVLGVASTMVGVALLAAYAAARSATRLDPVVVLKSE